MIGNTLRYPMNGIALKQYVFMHDMVCCFAAMTHSLRHVLQSHMKLKQIHCLTSLHTAAPLIYARRPEVSIARALLCVNAHWHNSQS